MDYLEKELKAIYETLFKEIELFKTQLKNIESYVKNESEMILKKINNPNIIVSVVTPAYNANYFLPKLYQSLTKQTIAKHVEWVIVDDHSTDNSTDFYESLKNDKLLGTITVFRNEKNLGAALALKRGFSLASSDILAWVSADDLYVSENKLEKDLELLENGFDLVFSKYTNLGPDTNNFKTFAVPHKNYVNKYHMFFDISFWNYLNCSSLCMKKNSYLDIGEFNEFLINVDGDFDLIVRSILLNKRIGFSDTIVFNHQHPQQISKAFEKMLVGNNITRLSYTRFLKMVAAQKNDLNKFLRDFGVAVLNKLGYASSMLKNGKNYYFIMLFRHSIWLEELTDKKLYEVFLKNIKNYQEILQKHEIFKNQIYELSDQFMKTKPFETFAKRFKEINS